MSDWKPKRFWKTTAVTEAETGYTVQLDGRPVRTPAKAALIMPSRQLAELVAAEWDAQEDQVDPGTMPATRGANAAIDKVVPQHAEVADMLAEYGDSDLLCYRADAPVELVDQQAAAWDPLLDWAADTYGARLEPRTGVIHAPQDPEALARLRREVHALDAFQLAAFSDLVSLSGSLVIGFAATRDAQPIEQLWDHSRLDEIWQARLWGADEEAEAHAALKKTSFLNAKRFFDSVTIGD